jgi:hypothetical protein
MKDGTPGSKFTFSCRPDCSAYDGVAKQVREFDASHVEFLIEFKLLPSYDPFSYHPTPQSHPEAPNPLMSTIPTGCEAAGQITAYATLVLGSEYRTHAFTILIIKDYARLIRWDRAGAIVTAPIQYNIEPYLHDFLTRYHNASREVRGHDVTVCPPDKDVELRARTVKELAKAKVLLSVAIPDPKQPLGLSHYIVCGPRTQPFIPVGRWTRTSIAYHVQGDKRVFLKDSWRVILEDITAEGDVYAMLHDHKVPNIPHCLLGSDIGDDFHRSHTDKFVRKFMQRRNARQFVPHQHYRLVLDTIGRKLEKFRCSREMVKAVRAVVLGELTKCHGLRNVF